MDFRTLSKNTKIPAKILRRMMEDGAFTEKMDDADQEFLYRLQVIITKHYFIRHCLLQIRTDKRDTFIKTSHLETKWERYLYSHMANHYTNGDKLTIPEIIKHAEKVFNFTFTIEHIEKVKKIRDTIYQKQSRHRLGKTLKDKTLDPLRHV